MRAPTHAPVYAAFFPILAEIAQKRGYALAVHGSLNSDMDLVAIPWTVTAVSADELVEALRLYAAQTMAMMFSAAGTLDGPEQKPHGRQAWSIIVGNGAVIDISVMPRVVSYKD